MSWLLIVAALMACGTLKQELESGLPVQSVPVPPDRYGAVLRLSEDQILVGSRFMQYLVLGEDRFISAFNSRNWSNNEEIIATRCLDPECEQAEVLKYDVREIVNSVP